MSTVSMRLVTAILLAAAPLAAQSASSVQLGLTCGRTPCVFRMGEVIPIELSFTASAAKRYQINMARYDRSGRMRYEEFHVTPQEGTRDPLQVYFSFGGFIGGGLTGFQFLSEKPVTIGLVLNEWLSFDRPGAYRLTISSVRVSDVTEKPGQWVPHGVASNEIPIEILPAEREWQDAELQRIVAALDDPNRSPGPFDANDPMTALRYLGTEGAARELARRLRAGNANGNGDFECMFGLIGSPNQAAGLAEMRVLLTDPDFPVNSMFLRTMSYLGLHAGESPEALQRQQQANIDGARNVLMAALPAKRGKAQAVSTETALEALSANTPAELRKPLIAQLLKSFGDLPAESQASWLEYRWDSIQDRSWIPVLQKVATAYQEFREFREMRAYQSLTASGAALRHWYELDPLGARAAVIAEIERPRPRYGADVLGMLKEKSLPEVEAVLLQNLANATDYEVEDHILSLLERYGTGSGVAALVAAKGELVGKWACAPQSDFLGYVLKNDPDAARPLLERAIAARGKESNACRHTIFMDVGTKHAGALLEELAVKALNDPDPEVAIDATRYLGRYGSADAEQPLWSRYLAWHATWVGRDDELVSRVAGEIGPNQWEANLGQALVNALAQGIGWYSDTAKLQRIKALAAGEYIRNAADAAIGSAASRDIVYFSGGGSRAASFHLAQYDQLTMDQLKKKLAQYPRSTVFQWGPAGLQDSTEQQNAFRELSQAASEAGMALRARQ